MKAGNTSNVKNYLEHHVYSTHATIGKAIMGMIPSAYEATIQSLHLIGLELKGKHCSVQFSISDATVTLKLGQGYRNYYVSVQPLKQEAIIGQDLV